MYIYSATFLINTVLLHIQTMFLAGSLHLKFLDLLFFGYQTLHIPHKHICQRRASRTDPRAARKQFHTHRYGLGLSCEERINNASFEYIYFGIPYVFLRLCLACGAYESYRKHNRKLSSWKGCAYGI